MEAASSKHRNLQHTLNASVRQQALQHLGEGAAAGLKILELRQRDMQQLFGKIFGVPTKSSNNEWLRSKLLQAVGLPPRWRPAPTPPPSPPRGTRPGEYSRFGRRLRASTASPVDSASDAEDDGEDEEGQQAKRKRARHASCTGSPAQQQQQQQQQQSGPASPATSVASPAAPGPQAALQAPSLSAVGTAAILSLQARASAAFASLPSSAACQPLILHPAPAQQHLPPAVAHLQMQSHEMQLHQLQQSQLLSSFELPSLQLPPLPPLAALQQPAAAVSVAPLVPNAVVAPDHLSCVRSVVVPVPPQCGPSRSHALAALLSDPDPRPPSPILLPPVPTLRSCMTSATLSTQLHNLYGEWEEGLLSFDPPSASLLHCLQ